MAHWERPRHPNGRFKKAVKESLNQTPPPQLPRVSLRELNAGKVFTENVEKSGGFTKFSRLADAVAAMEKEYDDMQQELQQKSATLEVVQATLNSVRDSLNRVVEQRDAAQEVNNGLRTELGHASRRMKELENSNTRLYNMLSSVRDENKQLQIRAEHAGKDYEGLPSRIRVLENQLAEIQRSAQRVLNPA